MSHTQHLVRFPLAVVALLALAHPALAADIDFRLPAGDGFVIRDNTGAIERLRVDEATGNISRNGALFVHTTGTDNTFVGEGAGNTGTTGVGKNSAFGKNALSSVTTGGYNSAFGQDALRANTTGLLNSAFGEGALYSNTTAKFNSAFGLHALRMNTTGYRNSAFGQGALNRNTTGNRNSAFGKDALYLNTASNNSAFGEAALLLNTTGTVNSAFGVDALRYNTIGNGNSAFGNNALRANTTGILNAAFGNNALGDNTTGFRNSAFGHFTLYSKTTGSGNTAIGYKAGFNQTTGSDNIYIDNLGFAGESGKIRIGRTAHTETFIEGINGNTATGGVAVLINSSNELHTLVSSARFKESVADMGESSQVLHRLRPVTFLYREEADGDGRTPEYGLIAEEVAEVAPELVALDAEGRPYSVRYHVLPSMLLNEAQKDRRTIHEHEQMLAAQQRTIETLLARVGKLENRPGEALRMQQ